jgi:hypothetical protein
MNGSVVNRGIAGGRNSILASAASVLTNATTTTTIAPCCHDMATIFLSVSSLTFNQQSHS